MQSGKLDKRIEFQALTETPDGHGGFVKSWTTHFKKWASVMPASWDESFRNDQDFATLRGFITVRFDAQTKRLDSKYRAVYGTRVFEIQGVANTNEANRQIQLNYLELI